MGQAVWISAIAAIFAALNLAACSGPENSITRNPCVEKDSDLGFSMKPGCKFEKTIRAGERIEYTYNALGLRDKDYAAKAPAGKVRILVMGPGLTSHRMTSPELPARRLESKLHREGLTQVEIINGAVEGYFAPRNAVLAQRLIKAYSPHVIVYFFAGEFVDQDFLEWEHAKLDEFGRPLKVDAPDFALEFPSFVQSIFGSSSIAKLGETYTRIKTVWDVQKSSPNRREMRQKILLPTIKSLKAINAAQGPYRSFYLSWGFGQADTFEIISAYHPFWNSFFQFFVPGIRIGGREVATRLAKEGGFILLTSPALRDANKAPPFEDDRTALTWAASAIWVEAMSKNLSNMLSGPMGDPKYFEPPKMAANRAPTKAKRR